MLTLAQTNSLNILPNESTDKLKISFTTYITKSWTMTNRVV